MSIKYNFKEIEEKWRKIWEENPVNPPDDSKPKYYCLDMFPYPQATVFTLVIGEAMFFLM